MPRFRLSGLVSEENYFVTSSTSAWPRRLLTLFLGLSLTTVFALALASTAHARPLYSCGNATSGTHCYAEADSDGWFPNAQGATVKIMVVQMQCSKCGGNNGTTAGFIDNEMWLTATGYRWVEVGYLTQADALHSWEEYFWADSRPVDPSGVVNYHPLGLIPSGDYNQYAMFTIKRSGSSSFHVTISSPNASKTGDSTNNTMTVSGVNMGQELAGNAGASAPYAHYIYRSYWNSSGVSKGVGTQYSPVDGAPPYWQQIPGTTVGDFETSCC